MATRQIAELNSGTLLSGLRGKVDEAELHGEKVFVSDKLECAALRIAVKDLVCVASAGNTARDGGAQSDWELFRKP